MLQKSSVKVLKEVSRHPRLSAKGQSDLGTFVVPSPDGDSEAGCNGVVCLLKVEKDAHNPLLASKSLADSGF